MEGWGDGWAALGQGCGGLEGWGWDIGGGAFGDVGQEGMVGMCGNQSVREGEQECKERGDVGTWGGDEGMVGILGVWGCGDIANM